MNNNGPQICYNRQEAILFKFIMVWSFFHGTDLNFNSIAILINKKILFLCHQ